MWMILKSHLTTSWAVFTNKESFSFVGSQILNFAYDLSVVCFELDLKSPHDAVPLVMIGIYRNKLHRWKKKLFQADTIDVRQGNNYPRHVALGYLVKLIINDQGFAVEYAMLTFNSFVPRNNSFYTTAIDFACFRLFAYQFIKGKKIWAVFSFFKDWMQSTLQFRFFSSLMIFESLNLPVLIRITADIWACTFWVFKWVLSYFHIFALVDSQAKTI